MNDIHIFISNIDSINKINKRYCYKNINKILINHHFLIFSINPMVFYLAQEISYLNKMFYHKLKLIFFN
jgi:hypothetical protein